MFMSLITGTVADIDMDEAKSDKPNGCLYYIYEKYNAYKLK